MFIGLYKVMLGYIFGINGYSLGWEIKFLDV